MRFNRVFIDKYGSFSNREFDFSNGSFYMLYGDNEVGKSTLLNLMRNLLFGHDDKAPEAKMYLKSEGDIKEGDIKGRVDFTLNDGRVGSVTRKWTSSKEKWSEIKSEFVATLDSKQLNESKLQSLLGVERDFFVNFSGFSYRELCTSQKLLSSANLTSLVYGLSFGNAERVFSVQNILKDRLDKCIRERSGNAEINIALAELEALEKKRNEASSAMKTSDYQKKKSEVSEGEKELDELEEKRKKAQEAVNEIKRIIESVAPFDDYTQREKILSEMVATSKFAESKLGAFTEKDCDEYRDLNSSLENYKNKLKETEQELEVKKLKVKALELNLDQKCLEEKNQEQIDKLYRDTAKYRSYKETLRKDEDEFKDTRGELLKRLVKMGFVPGESSESIIDDYSKLITDAMLAQAKDGEVKEKKFDEEKVGNERLQKEAHDRLEAAQRALDEFGENFDVPRIDEEIESAEAACKSFNDSQGKYYSIENKYSSLKSKVTELEDLETSLVANAVENGFELDSAQRALFLERCRRIPDPFLLGKYYPEYKDLTAELKEKVVELKQFDDDIQEKEKELEEKGCKDFEEVEGRYETTVNRQDELWNELRACLLDGNAVHPDTIRLLVNAYDESMKRVKQIYEERYSKASLRGEHDVITRELKNFCDKRDAVRTIIQEIESKKGEIVKKATEILKNCGWYEFCASWPLDSIELWHEKFDDFRTMKTEVDEKVKELLRESSKVADVWRRLLKESSCLGVKSVSDTTIPDVFSSLEDVKTFIDAFSRLESLCEDLNKRVEKRKKLLENFKSADKACKDAADEVQKRDDEFQSLRDSRERLDKKRQAFIKELPIPIVDNTFKSWKALANALEKLVDWRKDYEKCCKDRKEIDERQEHFEKFITEVKALAEEFDERRDVASCFEPVIEGWHKTLQEHRDVQKKMDELKAERETCQNVLKDKSSKLAKFKERLGEDGPRIDEFFNFLKDYQKALASRDNAKSKLEASLGISSTPEKFDNYLSYLQENSLEALESERNNKENLLNSLQTALKEKYSCVNKIELELKEFENSDELRRNAVAYQNAVASLRRAVNEYVPLKMAHDALERSIIDYEDRIPEIMKDVTEFFGEMTDGAYKEVTGIKPSIEPNKKSAKKIRIDLKRDDAFHSGDYDEYEIKATAGKSLKVDDLSVGAREQLFLSIRLALLKKYNATLGVEKLPILGDDILVQFDDNRLEKTLGFFKKFSEDNGCQVILMTHHHRTLEIFRMLMGGSHDFDYDLGEGR